MAFDSDNSSVAKKTPVTTFTNENDKFKLTYQTADNLHTVVIRTTEDKLKNHLKDYKEVSTYPSYFLGVLGIFITLVITLATIEKFNTRWGIASEVWQAFFMLLTVVVALSVIYFGYKWYQCKSVLNIDKLIEDIKTK